MCEQTIYDYEITVLGEPKAQGRHRARNAGKFIQMYDDLKSRNAKRSLLSIIQDRAPRIPLDCPLQLDLEFHMPRPKNHYRTGKNAGLLREDAPDWHTSKPDKDNLRKLVMDAMNRVFWRDDSLICAGTTIKVYSERPRTVIKLRKL